MTEFEAKPKPTNTSLRLVEAREAISNRLWGSGDLAFNHNVLAQLSLPYRSQGEQRSFLRSSGAADLRVEAGAVPRAGGGFVEVGIPYGPKARLILILLSTLAVKTQSRTVEVDTSFRRFVESCGITMSGKNNRAMKEQLLRLSAVSMRLAITRQGFVDVYQGPIFNHFQVELPNDPRQQFLWNSEVSFSQGFYDSLSRNAVPLERDAVIALKHSARALDIYTWLASRLFRLKSPITIRWTSLRHQFGTPSQGIESFKRAFATAMKTALVVYPEAKVESVFGGIRIYPSLPPVPTRSQRRLM